MLVGGGSGGISAVTCRLDATWIVADRLYLLSDLLSSSRMSVSNAAGQLKDFCHSKSGSSRSGSYASSFASSRKASTEGVLERSDGSSSFVVAIGKLKLGAFHLW